jgi:hypothetical protein
MVEQQMCATKLLLWVHGMKLQTIDGTGAKTINLLLGFTEVLTDNRKCKDDNNGGVIPSF